MMQSFNPWDLVRLYGIPIDNLNKVTVSFTNHSVLLICRTYEGESVIYERSLGPITVNPSPLAMEAEARMREGHHDYGERVPA